MIQTAQTTLAYGRVRLSRLRIENIYRHYAWNNDPELNKMDSEIPFRQETFGDFKKRFERLVYDPVPGEMDFEVHAEDGTLIGVAYVGRISDYNRHCRVGVTIGDRQHRGKGYGREVLHALLAYCFQGLSMHRVCAETFAYNAAWKRLLEEAGFCKEGTERDYIFRDGTFWDKEVYALLDREYQAASAA